MGADLFAPSDVPKMVPVGDFRGLDLTPEEGFLLSRIDGRVNVGSLLSMLGWEKTKVQQLLESLLRKHLLNFDRSEIADRVFGRMIPDPPAAGEASEASATPGVSITLTPVAEKTPDTLIDPNTIEKVPDLTPEKCIEILRFSNRVEKAENLYQIFEIPIGADPRSVKRQYRQMALVYHPDKFFRKNIGGYRLMLEEAWKQVQEAYELLSDGAKRSAYDLELKAQQRLRPKQTSSEKLAAGDTGTVAATPVAPAKAPIGTPPPPGPSRAPAGTDTKAPDVPPWEGNKASQAIPPRDARPRVESTVERQMRQQIEVTLGKAKRHFDQAKKDFSDKKYASADSNIKLAIQFDGRNEDYKKWYESVKKELELGIVTSLIHRAELAEASGEMKNAQEEYEKALTLFPDNASANLAVGKILAAKGEQLKRARDCLAKGLASKPNDLVALLAICGILRTMGLAKSAGRYIEKAKELAPKDARVLEEVKQLKKAAR